MMLKERGNSSVVDVDTEIGIHMPLTFSAKVNVANILCIDSSSKLFSTD